MSGMAMLLLCTLQVDHSGWRTQSQRGPAEAAANVEPSRSGDVWQEADQLLERAGDALQHGVSDAQEFVRQQQDRGTGDVRDVMPRAALGDAAPSTPSGWPEFEHALGQAAAGGAAAARSASPTLRERIRGPEHIAVAPPSPPGGTVNERGDPAAWPPDEASASSFLDPSQRHSAAESDPQITPQAVSQIPAQDRNSAEPVGGREVIFEGPPDMPVAGRQRYLSPPPRDDELAPVRRHETSEREPPTVGPSAGMDSPEDQLRARAFPAPPAASGANHRTETADTSDAGSPDRPWGPLLMAVLGLFGSLGFNFYLGWIAWDLYARYQDAVDDIQELEAKLEAQQHELAVSAVPRAVARRTQVAAG